MSYVRSPPQTPSVWNVPSPYNSTNWTNYSTRTASLSVSPLSPLTPLLPPPSPSTPSSPAPRAQSLTYRQVCSQFQNLCHDYLALQIQQLEDYRQSRLLTQDLASGWFGEIGCDEIEMVRTGQEEMIYMRYKHALKTLSEEIKVWETVCRAWETTTTN